ncbi:MAG: hypothetical protein IIW21_03070 [Clostridia bacterium]|jgi:hypothetical protein|nr:hypothetical protein [Clostridia bacterium]
MKIVKTVERELTENELLTVERFRSYTDGVSFALIGDNVTVMLDEVESNDVELLKSEAQKLMSELLHMHPDFDVIHMDDGSTMILMNTGVVAFSSVDPASSGMRLHLELRGMCLEACERGEVIAVAFEEDAE